MRVITEAELRDQYKQDEFTSFSLPAGTRLTPSAQQFLSERRIKLVSNAGGEVKPPHRAGAASENSGKGYIDLPEGWEAAEKPEHLTHINGRALVQKNHPRIRFRGKLDSLEAYLILAIPEVEGQGYRQLARDLSTLLEYTRQIMSAEVRGEPLAPLNFFGLSTAEIREHSHHPQKHYGVPHIFPQPWMGRAMAQLNLLRTQCRELELAAMDAFYGQAEGQERSDILQSCNRLSSLVYIMMLQLTSGDYKLGQE